MGPAFFEHWTSEGGQNQDYETPPLLRLAGDETKELEARRPGLTSRLQPTGELKFFAVALTRLA